MAKRRINAIYLAFFLTYTGTGSTVFLFCRQDFSKQHRCRMYTVLMKTAYFAAPILLFSTGSLLMFFNYVITIYKLSQNSKPIKDGRNTKIEKLPKNNVKLTRAIVMTLTAYIVLYMPVIAVTCVGTIFGTFNGNFIWDILEDISLLCYFSNNLVNPFIYYMTLRDFRDGYRRLLFCCMRQPVKKNPPIDVAVIWIKL